jgi:CBS domain-containing protein
VLGGELARIVDVMARIVRDIMNPQLLYVTEGDACDAVRDKLVQFGVTGAPVLDPSYRPVGFVSLRDLVGDRSTVMAMHPAFTTRAEESVENAARALATANLRHFVVIDAAGTAVGVVSALDFVRALSGLPPRHPPRFDVDCSSAEAYPDNVDG